MEVRMAKHPKLLLAGVVGLLLVPAAQAVTTVSADLHDLGWVLTDLDPNDGVTPSITFSGNSYVQAAVGVSPWPPLRNSGGSEVGLPTSTDAGDPAGTHVQSSLDPAAAGGYRLQVQGQATGGGQYFDGEVRFEEGACCFLLSPNTRAVFSGVATLTASRSGGSPDDTGSAQAALVVVGPGVGEVAQLEDALILFPGWSGLQSFASRSLQVGYLNDTAEPLWGGFNARVSAQGIAFTSAVPEPATGAALLAGIGLLGLLRRGGRTRTATLVP
jgi:hypothetical protein